MANSKKAQTKVVGTTIDAMIEEGKALARIWKQTNSLTASTKASGFDTRLGKLLQQLKASSSLDSGQISRETLTTHGVHVIDRRRRAEALWFVENEVECRDFIKASKKGFTSLTALQAAMRKASKEAEAPTAKAEKVKATPAKAEPSNVGQSPAKPASKQDIFDKLVKVCEFSGIDMLEIAEMIIDHSEVGKYVQYTETSTEVAA